MKESNKTEQDLLIEVQGDQLRFEEKRLPTAGKNQKTGRIDR